MDLDAKTAEKINELAKSLRELHLAATMEEAYQRAREIILGVSAKGKEQTIKEMLTKAASFEREEVREEKAAKEELEEVHKEAMQEELMHEAEKIDTEAAIKAVKKTKEELEEAKKKLEALEQELKNVENEYKETQQ